MEEIWKDVKGYEGYYQVSNLGRVKSIERVIQKCRYGTRHLSERIRKTFTDKDGYLFVTFSHNNVRKTVAIHRLVAITFIPKPKGTSQVHHLDGNKANNCVDNLKWI